MKHVGIICEYNPLHTGHARLLRAVRGADTVICLMSGNFTQRGEAAVLPPSVRAEMAVAAGADLVLELPFPQAAASAAYFAAGGVRALAALGADTLAFGSEVGDASALAALAEKLPRGNYRKTVANGAQNTGDAAAFFGAAGVTASSNDILGVAYVQAIADLRAPLSPFVIKREGAAYSADTLGGEAHPSATALRRLLELGEDISSYVPKDAREAFLRGVMQYGLADTGRLGSAMLARLRLAETSPVSGDIAECGGGLLGRLRKAAMQATDYRTLLSAAATKRYTDGRIRRALLALMAGVTQKDLTAPPSYLRLLAMNKRGREYLGETAKIRTVPVVTRPSEITALGEGAARQRALSLVSDGLYALCLEKPLLPHTLQTATPYFKQ